MTPEEFEVAKQRLNTLSGNVVAVARLILVEGMAPSAAAQEVGMSRQSANGAMKRVRALLASRPADWVYFEGWMPESLAIEIRAKLKDLESKKQVQ